MIRTVLIMLVQLFAIGVVAQSNTAYQLYNAKGKKISYKKMVRQLEKADIVLFGEQHNNPISHWLQLELTNSLAAKRDLTLGAEMIETDNQEYLDQYLAGEIDQKGLDTLARLWQNYQTDYAPLVDFARDNDIRFIGTNVPRRYASMVY